MSPHSYKPTSSKPNIQPDSPNRCHQLHQTRGEVNNFSSPSIFAASPSRESRNNLTANMSHPMRSHTQKSMEQPPFITPLMQLEAQIKSLRPISKIMEHEYAGVPYGKPAPERGLVETYALPAKSPIRRTSIATVIGSAIGEDINPTECNVLFFEDSNGSQLKLNHEMEIRVHINAIYKANGLKRFSGTVSKFHNKFMYLVFGMGGNDKEWKNIHEALQKDRLSVKWIVFDDGALCFGLSFIGGPTRIVAPLCVKPPDQEKKILHERVEQTSDAITITVPPNLTVRLVVGANKLGRRLYETTIENDSNCDAIAPTLADLPVKIKKRRRRRGRKAPKSLIQDLLSTLHEDEKRVAAGKPPKGFRLHVDFGAEGTQGDLHGNHPSYRDLDIFADELPTPTSWLKTARRALRKVMVGMGERMAKRAERVRVNRSGHKLNTSRMQDRRELILASKDGQHTVTLMAKAVETENKTVIMPVPTVAENATTILQQLIITQPTTKTDPITPPKCLNAHNIALSSTKSLTPINAKVKRQKDLTSLRTSPTTPGASRTPQQGASTAKLDNPKPAADRTPLAGKALDLKSRSPQRAKRDPSTIKRVPLAELKNIKLQKPSMMKTTTKASQIVGGTKKTSARACKIDSFAGHSSTISSVTPVSIVTKKIHVNERVAPEATTALLNIIDQELKKPVSSNTQSGKETPAFEKREKTSPATFKNNSSCPVSITKDIQASPKNCQNKVQGESYAKDHLPARPVDKTVEKSTSTQCTRNCYDPSSKTPKHRKGKSPIQNASCHTITRQVSMEKRAVVNLVDIRKQPDKLRSPTTQHHRHNNTGCSL